MTIEWSWVVGPVISGGIILIGAFFIFKKHIREDFPKLVTNVKALENTIGDLAVAVGRLSEKADGHDYRIRRLESKG